MDASLARYQKIQDQEHDTLGQSGAADVEGEVIEAALLPAIPRTLSHVEGLIL